MAALPKQEFASPSSSGLRIPGNASSRGPPLRRSLQPHMLSRASDSTMATNSQYQGNNGSVGPELANTHFRHDAGMPSLHHGRDWPIGLSYERGPALQNAWRQHEARGQQQTFNQQLGFGGQANTGNQTAFRSHNNITTDSATAGEHAQVQQILFSAAQEITDRSPFVSHDTSAATTELREMSQRHMGHRRNSQNQQGVFLSERGRINVMTSQQQLLQNALAERDRACGERDNLLAQLTALDIRYQESKQRLEGSEEKNSATIHYLRDQIRFKDEQIKGKRALWMEMESHKSKNSGAERTSDARDPFATPLARKSRFGLKQTKEAEELPSTPGPFNLSGTLNSQNHDQFWPYHGVNPGSQAEDGKSPIVESKALIPFKSEDHIVQEFREDFDSIYNLVEIWVQSYAHIVNDDMSFDQQLSHDSNLWPFFLKCTYENFADAHDHTILLLRDSIGRPALITRLIIQYFYTSMWKATAFGLFDQEHQERLECIELQLKTKGLDPAQRANLVAAQTAAIKSIVADKEYLEFRTHSLSAHTKMLRQLLGPLLDEGVDRQEAAMGIGAVAVNAWDLSAKLFTSNYTFLFNFPACNTRFIHPSMKCDDPTVRETELQLHIRQAKIRLVIKPIITMRNDRNMTISVKQLQNAHVLIFK